MAQNERWKTGIPVEESSGGERWKSGIPVEPEKPRTRGLLEAVNDNVIEFANAAAGGVSALANMVKPGNAVSGFIDENIIKAGEAKQSDVVRAEKQALGQNLQNAQGIGDELGAVGGYVMNNPLLAASQAAGSFALPGGAVKGAGKAAQVLGAGAKGVETAGRVGGIAAGAAMAGGDAAGTAYELSSNAGATEDQATAAGRQASVIPALVGGVTGAFGAERLLAGAKGFGGNALSRGLKSGLSEAGQEAVEEGVTQFEGQRAAMPYDATIDPTKGVAGAAAMGGIMGFGPGAALGAMGGGPELPSKQMGIDPSAGPLSRAAASAVDSAPPPQLGFSPLAGTPTIYPDGSVTLNGEQDFQKRNPGVQKGMDLSKIAQPSQPLAAERKPAQPEPQPDPVPMESRSLDELRQAFRGAQDPAIRKTLAAEIRKRREAMPDPIAPVQPSLIDQPGEPASVVTPPEPVQASQKEPQAPAAEPAPAVLGQPLTDAGTNLLGRGADPLQSIVAEKNDAVRANNEENGALADDVLNAMREFNPGGEMPSKDDVLRRIAEQGQDKARSTIEMFKTMVADRKGQVEKIEGMYTKSKKGQADEARAKASAPTDTPAATAPAVRSTGVSGVDEQGSVPALKPKEWADRETAPVGSWVKADYKLQDSQPLYQVRELDPKSLFLPELDEKGRLQPEKRKYLAPYAERAKAGEKPPAITVIEMEDGRMRVVDGNRRVMAAIEAGSKNIRALVSPLVNTPDGKKEASIESLAKTSPAKGSTSGPPSSDGSSSDRPARWRQNALQAGKVARSLGLDPKGKRLAQIVAEIDAKDRAVVAESEAPARRKKLIDGMDGLMGSTRKASIEYVAKQLREDIAAFSKMPFMDEAISDAKQKLADYEAIKDEAISRDDRDLKEGIQRTMLIGARDELKAAVQNGELTQDQADSAVAQARATGNTLGAVDAIDAAIDAPKKALKSNVQNAPQGTAAKAAAPAVEASTPAGGNAAAAKAVPAADRGNDVQADGVKEIARLRKAAEDAPPISQQAVDAIRALRVAVTKDAEDALSKGVVPVYVSTTGVTHAITPSAQQSGMVQVTRYNKTGAIGDSQYSSVAKAIEDNQIDEDRLPSAEAEAHMQTLVEAEAEYQRSRKERMEANAPAPAPAKKVDRAASLRKAEWKKNPLRSFLGQHGLSIDLAKEFAPGITERRKAMVGGYGPIFRKAGKNIDLLAEIAREEGFISADQDATDLYELIAAVFRGERVAPMFTATAAQDEMQARMEAMQQDAAAGFDDFLAEQKAAGDPLASLLDDDYTLSDIDGSGYAEASPEIKAEVAALSAQLEVMGVDVESIAERIAQQTTEKTAQEYHEALQTALQQAHTETQAAKPAGIRNPGEDGRSQTGAQGGLTAPTRADIEAQQARTEQADKLDERAQVKRESEVGDTSFMTGFDGDGRQDTTGGLFDAPVERFEAGNSLTKEQRKTVLASLVDVYKQKGADREMKGLDRNGNERFGYVHSPDLFEKSDITGAMVRYYVTMPDGRKAHPTELFPDYTQSDIDAEMAARETRKRDRESDVKRATVPAQVFSTPAEATAWWDRASAKSTRTASGLPTVFPASERKMLTDGSKFIMVPATSSGELLEAFADAGWKTAKADTAAQAEPDYLKELFGVDAKAIDADPFAVLGAAAEKSAGQQAKDIARIRESIKTEKARAKADYDDWSGRVYKRNKAQVDLNGDGPSNQASMSVGAINESRRRNAMEALNKELTELDKLEKAVSTDDGAERVIARLNMLMGMAQKAVESGTGTFKTVDEQFQYMLLDSLEFRGPSGKGNITSNGLSKAMLAAVKPAAAQAEKPEDDAFMGVKDESPIFYSALRKEIEGLNLKSAPFLGWHGQLQGLVRAGKVKADELEWTGISEWLKLQTGKVSKEDVLAFLDANGVQVTETVLGGSTRTAEFDKFVQKMNDKYGEDWDSNIEQLTEAEFEIYETVPVKPEQSPKYSQYTLPGGENYREVLLTLPAKEQYGIAQRIAEGDKVWVVVDAAGQVAPGTSAFAMEKAAREEARAMNAERGTKAYNSGHWDQPNVLAHIRVNDRVDADGKRVLFVEEIQSDWGQDGKKSGFADRTEKKYTATRKGNWYPGDDSMGKFEVFVDGRSVGFFKANSADYAIAEAQGNSRDMSNRIPAAPFVDKTDKWLALSLKRIMKMAVDGGYDRVAFVNGEQSAERYSLDKQISKVEWITRPVSEKGTNSTPPTDGTLRAWDKNGNSVIDQQMEAADLGDNIGKELAQNLIDMKPSRQTGAGKDVRELAGIDLKVPAKGMRDFYDKIVPAAVKDVLKKVGGGQAEPVAITTNDDGWRITPPDENVHGKWMLKSSDYSSKGELYETEQKAKDAMAEKMGALKQPGFTITEAMREKVAGGLPLFAGSKAKNRGAGTPTDRAIMEMAAEGREANEILSFIAKASKSPYRRLLAQKLLATGANPAVSLGGEMGGGAGFRFLAKYSRKNHEVTLSEDASDRAEQIFLHETTHAATLLALDKGGLMATQMNRLYEQVKANGAAEGQYGLKNVGEFVAEAFTNPEFQKTLKGIKVEGGTVWQRFVNMVRRVLGLESSQQDALSAALDMGAKVMRENMPLRAAKSFRAEDGPAFAGVDQTETPAFKRWFGNSAVLDSAGKPLVVYHGTGAAIDKFRATDGGSLGEGIYFTADPEAASRFAERKGGEMNVMPVFISASRVLDADNITEEQRKAIDAAIPKNADELVSFGFPKAIAEESREFIDRDLKKILSAKRFDPKSLSLAVQGGPASVIEEIYKKAGFDAITRMSDGLIGRPAFREYLAFRPEQIKSATGNNGNFDPNDADIANFGVADAVEQIKQFDVKTAPKNTWAHYRGMAMQALGRRQIVDLYQKEVPQLVEYDQLVQEMDAAKNDSGSKADQLAQDWGKLKDEKALAELMHDATLARIDPSKPMPDGYPKAEFARLKARYDALSPEGKALFGKARDMYKDHYRAVQQAIKDRIERSEMSESQKKKMMASLDEKLFKELEGVYFPLARFGQYVIVVKDGNGEVKNVTRAETVKEAEEARKELMKAFPAAMGNTVGKVLKQAEFNAGRDAVGKGFMADLMGALDEKGVDDELRDTVAQLYLSSLPDLSWAKHGIHRKGTPGFSQDARRAFAQNMFHGARYLAKLRYADQLQDQLSEMQDHVKAYEGVDEYDSIEAQQVVDEMVKRHEILMNPKSSPVSTALTSFGFLFHMGLSPASAMVNLTQTALVAFPQMGAKWGFTKSAAALTKASEEVVRAKNDLSTVLKGDELEAFNQAVKDGTIDVTMAHDLAGIAQGEDQGVMWKVRPVMRWASFMFHHAEKFNRQATFIAAYRLAKEKNPGADARFLYDQAKTATYDGHYDYSSANRPRVMQGNWQRVILLFKAFAQNTIYVLARNAHQSIKGLRPEDRAQARKTLGGILATHAAAAGVLGLPIVGPLLTVASWIGGDDDEPWDAEVAMQNAMAEMLGPKAAEVLARGFSRLTPFDLSGRVALNKLILPDVQEGLEGKEWAESAMAAALGPVAGIGINVARGVQKITEGDYLRGLEDMMPTALRGPLKALRYGSEGAIDKTGVVITDEVSTAGILGQASGFAPSQVRRDTERRSAIYGYDRALLERRSVLMRMMAEARIQGDNETAQEVLKDIQAFNQKHPNRRITPMNIAQSARNRRKRVEEAEQGVYLPKKRKDALDAVSF